MTSSSAFAHRGFVLALWTLTTAGRKLPTMKGNGVSGI